MHTRAIHRATRWRHTTSMVECYSVYVPAPLACKFDLVAR
jgi:hypothetical protein